MSGLADQHALCFAPREIQNLSRYQVVEQDHVGGLQCPHRTQRQQFRIAGAGADQRDRALFGHRRVGLGLPSSASKSARVGAPFGFCTARSR